MLKPNDTIAELTREALAKAGFSVSIAWHEGVIPRMALASETDLAVLVGVRGETLQALEHVIRLMAFRALPDTPYDFVLDINNYRESQTTRLVEMAKTKADQVLATGRAESLTPMNAFERKVVHTELALYPNLKTESIGSEPNRRVVIKLA